MLIVGGGGGGGEGEGRGERGDCIYASSSLGRMGVPGYFLFLSSLQCWRCLVCLDEGNCRR